MTSFGTILKDLRGHIGLSQAELAARLGSTQRHISFLETGRSTPTESFLQRLCRELGLSQPQQANLYAACSWRSARVAADFDPDEITQALNMLDRRVLRNWPFPAMVLDKQWNIIRHNDAFTRVFQPMMTASNLPANLMAVFLSQTFRGLITNWPEVAPAIFFRLQSAASQDPTLAQTFAQARAEGVFDSVDLNGETAPSVYVPIRMTFPNGAKVNTSSLMAQLSSVHDALVDGFEIEMILPLDDASEETLRAMLAQ